MSGEAVCSHECRMAPLSSRVPPMAGNTGASTTTIVWKCSWSPNGHIGVWGSLFPRALPLLWHLELRLGELGVEHERVPVRLRHARQGLLLRFLRRPGVRWAEGAADANTNLFNMCI